MGWWRKGAEDQASLLISECIWDQSRKKRGLLFVTGRWLEPQSHPLPAHCTVSQPGVKTLFRPLGSDPAPTCFVIKHTLNLCDAAHHSHERKSSLTLVFMLLSCRRQCGSCPTSQQVTSNRCRPSLMPSWFPWSFTCSIRFVSILSRSCLITFRELLGDGWVAYIECMF